MPYKILNVPKNGMIDAFEAALKERGSVADPAQHAAAMRLQVFYDALIALKAARRNALRKLLFLRRCLTSASGAYIFTPSCAKCTNA